ncbi:hypothetical protein [Rhizobium sp. 007]|uniref:hypothetical protein n=1 Tax=Rhizobium sp. 007 TaxID=2785056 RepID=UPI00189078CA|nr:hypothetical protein [Rhizobium sp. 007]QPB19576.1 hypothetical protein ISN39_18765 [Rhizobium sp. 007]
MQALPVVDRLDDRDFRPGWVEGVIEFDCPCSASQFHCEPAVGYHMRQHMSSVDAEEANFTDTLLDFTCLQLGTITPDQVLIDRTPQPSAISREPAVLRQAAVRLADVKQSGRRYIPQNISLANSIDIDIFL